MNVAVLCEFSGVVRDAFTARGHVAVSCDLLPSETPGPHIRGDCRDHDWSVYDLVIAHPPCTHLAVSGARWFGGKRVEQAEALAFVRWIMALPVARLALENPISVISTAIRRPDQVIQPWWFGHPETKATCLWLWGLPPLVATNPVEPTNGSRVWRLPESSTRWMERSRTLPGVAAAMADQWSSMPAQMCLVAV